MEYAVFVYFVVFRIGSGCGSYKKNKKAWYRHYYFFKRQLLIYFFLTKGAVITNKVPQKIRFVSGKRMRHFNNSQKLIFFFFHVSLEFAWIFPKPLRMRDILWCLMLLYLIDIPANFQEMENVKIRCCRTCCIYRHPNLQISTCCRFL